MTSLSPHKEVERTCLKLSHAKDLKLSLKMGKVQANFQSDYCLRHFHSDPQSSF